jgi:hypothetical protein
VAHKGIVPHMAKLKIHPLKTIDLKNMAQQVNLSDLPDYVAHVRLGPLISALREKKRIVVITRARISASAGSK